MKSLFKNILVIVFDAEVNHVGFFPILNRHHFKNHFFNFKRRVFEILMKANFFLFFAHIIELLRKDSENVYNNVNKYTIRTVNVHNNNVYLYV